jgi:hypothetical protein
MTAVLSIAHLSRAELVQLISVLETAIEPVDIALARWMASREEWDRLAQKAAALWPARLVASEAWEKRPSSLRARRRYEEARTALERAELASSRAWTAYQRRYTEYEKLKPSRAA